MGVESNVDTSGLGEEGQWCADNCIAGLTGYSRIGLVQVSKVNLWNL